MKLSTWLTIGTLCVATGTFQSATVRHVAADQSDASIEGSLGSQSVLEAVGSIVDVKDADCLDKGFDAETLDCRVCNLLALTLSLQLEENGTSDAAVAESKQRATEDAVAKCQRCCTDVEAIDALTHQQQYTRVVLEVCTCKFGRLPKIANFVNNHATKHPRLEIEYINARMPHLLFYDEAGEKKEEISIASWDEETISEFIEAKLKPMEEHEQATAEDETTGQENEKTEDDVVEVEITADTQ